MKRLLMAAILAALAASTAAAKDKISYAYLIDPVLDAFTYAIKSGKIKSDLIDVELTALSVPALVQATATKQYDVVMTAAIAIPQAAERGLQLRILSVGTRFPKGSRGGDVWVLNTSPYKTVQDLKGKTISVSSLDSTNTTWVRLGLWKKYGVDVRYEGGDFKWVELPRGALTAALSTGKVDAAVLSHSQAILALKSKEYRSLARTAADAHEVYGVALVAGVNVAYPERLQAKPELYREFGRMLKQSREYALANVDEVQSAIMKKANMPAGFFKDWVELIGESPATLSDEDIKSLEIAWRSSKELGIIKSYPPVRSLVWEHAPKAE
jgi:NitT/TauT family transport system substrate-binding protein